MVVLIFLKMMLKICIRLYEIITSLFLFVLVPTVSEVITDVETLQPGVQDFEQCAVVGRGHFAEVRVVREKATGDVCALKAMNKAVLRTRDNVSLWCFANSKSDHLLI